MATKNNPGRFNCYENAEPDEPMFVLLGRDRTAFLVVTFWVKLRLLLGQKLDDPQIDEARTCVRSMKAYAQARGKDVEGARRAFESVVRLPGRLE